MEEAVYGGCEEGEPDNAVEFDWDMESDVYEEDD